VFDYPYERIAHVLGKSRDAVRQLGSRARRQVDEGTPHFETSREQRDRLAVRFFDAFEEGNLEELEALLVEDATLRGDGGGIGGVGGGRPLRGRVRCARALRAARGLIARMGTTLRRAEVNGEPGVLILDPDGRIVSVITVDVAAGGVRAVHSVFNPDKLDHLGPVADHKALFEAVRRRARAGALPSTTDREVPK
jgi:RNA polymerase sigma-70 factor (ECF subfamily)